MMETSEEHDHEEINRQGVHDEAMALVSAETEHLEKEGAIFAVVAGDVKRQFTYAAASNVVALKRLLASEEGNGA